MGNKTYTLKKYITENTETQKEQKTGKMDEDGENIKMDVACWLILTVAIVCCKYEQICA